MQHRISINYSQVSETGVKSVNEDACDLFIPKEDYQLHHKGVVAIVADGVSSAEAGKQASRISVQQFIQDFYRTPDTWSVEHAGKQVLSTINNRLHRLSESYRVEGKGFLCTFSAVVIKSQTLHCFQVGDSRIYHIRDGNVSQVTRDHSIAIGKDQNILSRALGMDSVVHVDYFRVALEPSDDILISSDGIHDFLHEQDFLDGEGQLLHASELLKRALKNDSNDNLSAISIHIETLERENIDEFNARLMRLPFPPLLQKGMILDGYEILEEIYSSSRSQLFRVKGKDNKQILVMKTPSLNYEEDNHYIDRFIQEEWIGSRIDNNHVVKVIKPEHEKHFLYYLMEEVDGKTLEKWMKENPSIDPATSIHLIEQIAQALKAFHEQDTVHQDLRPANIMVDKHLNVKIVDFGSVNVAGIEEMTRPISHGGALGTASYADPMYIQGRQPGVLGDIYSLGVIAYELFTRHLPYGDDIDECQTAMDFDRLRYKSARKHNPHIPVWFDRTLRKSVRFDIELRYHSIDAFLRDLKYPNDEFLRDDPKQQMVKSPLLFWQLLSLFWVITLIMMVVLFSG